MADDKSEEEAAASGAMPMAGSPDTDDAGAEARNGPGGMDTAMLDLLVCPLTKKPLHYDAEANELVSEAAGLAYPVRGGVPILLPSEARPLRDEPVPGAGR